MDKVFPVQVAHPGCNVLPEFDELTRNVLTYLSLCYTTRGREREGGNNGWREGGREVESVGGRVGGK